MKPKILTRRYCQKYDYVIIFDGYCKLTKNLISVLKEDRWINVRIDKKLDLNKFTKILDGYSVIPMYENDDYWMYFNQEPVIRMPKISPETGIHNHIKVEIQYQDKILYVKPTNASRYYLLSGGMELNETPIQAAEREIQEELGIKLSCQYVNSEETQIKIPIIDQPILTITHNMIAKMDHLPTFNLNKKEIIDLIFLTKGHHLFTSKYRI